jgi:cytoskeleton protein RodZ
MKQKTVPQENNHSERSIDGPGSLLRKARERKGLEQAKVAAQLHLSESMIQALERDDYKNLPAAVFVQGYLKNYARLLDVDEKAVIQAYQGLQPDTAQQPLVGNQPDNVVKELHSDHRLILYTTWFVLIVLGVLIFFWWQGRMDSTESPQQTEEQQAEELHGTIEPAFAPTQEDEVAPLGDEVPPPFSEPDPQPSTSMQEAPLLPADEESPIQPVAGEPVPDEAERIEALAPLSETPATPASEAPDILVSETPAIPASDIPAEILPLSEADAESEMPTPISDGLVVFEFTGPCWVEVRDANGRMRIIGVMRDGMRRSLDAQLGPFSVVIGDIQAARLTVNGENYDLSRHTRGKVARFTLDPSRL